MILRFPAFWERLNYAGRLTFFMKQHRGIMLQNQCNLSFPNFIGCYQNYGKEGDGFEEGLYYSNNYPNLGSTADFLDEQFFKFG